MIAAPIDTGRVFRFCYLAVREGSFEFLKGLGTNVQAHPAFGDGIHVHDLVVGIGGEFISNADIGSQVQLDALLGGDFLEFAGKIQLVVFDQGSTHTHTTGLEEGEHHATAQDEFVDFAQHVLNDRDLGRDLSIIK